MWDSRKANTEDQAATGLESAKLNDMPGQGCCAKGQPQQSTCTSPDMKFVNFQVRSQWHGC